MLVNTDFLRGLIMDADLTFTCTHTAPMDKMGVMVAFTAIGLTMPHVRFVDTLAVMAVLDPERGEVVAMAAPVIEGESRWIISVNGDRAPLALMVARPDEWRDEIEELNARAVMDRGAVALGALLEMTHTFKEQPE